MEDSTATILDLALMLLTPVLGWVAVKASKWMSAKEANEKTGGMLARLTDSVFVAVKKVNQTTRAQLAAARSPDSPGGAKVTPEEASQLKQAAWAEINAYWGVKGLEAAGKVLGLGDVNAFVDGKIEAAVHDLNAGKTGDP